MKGLSLVFGDIQHTKLGGADSFSDQLSCKYTVFVLTLFVIIATTRVYVKAPIECYNHGDWSYDQMDFINDVCWVSDTYWLPEFGRRALPASGVAGGRRINYYQWVTLLMVGQAFLFYLPRPIWRLLNKKSGIAVSSITDAAIECYRKADSALTNTSLKSMTTHLGRLLSDNGGKRRRRSCLGPLDWLFRSGNYLVTAYICVKMLYLANAIGQLYLLSDFLSTDYHLYGFQVLRNLVNGEASMASKHFPKITMCHFKIKALGYVNRHTVQCALPLNFFFEAMYIFLWFWIVLVAVVTACSLLWWLLDALFVRSHVDSIRSLLVDMKRVSSELLDDETDKFVRGFLRRDGCFILKLVGRNSSDVLMTELVCCLWDLYVSKSKHKDLPQRGAPALNARNQDGGDEGADQSLMRSLTASNATTISQRDVTDDRPRGTALNRADNGHVSSRVKLFDESSGQPVSIEMPKCE